MSQNEALDAAMFYDELTRQIGEAILKLSPICDRMGWERPDGARPYLHARSISTAIVCDFIDWTCNLDGSDEARERLRGVASDWGLTDENFAAAIAERLA